MKQSLKTGLLTALICLVSLPSIARQITKEELTNYFEKVVSLYTGDDMQTDEILAFLDEYVSEDAHFVLKMNYSSEAEQREAKFNFEQLKQTLREHFGRMFGSEARYKIEETKFNEDKTEVVVKYHFWHNTGVTTFDQQRGLEAQVQFRSLALCEEKFALEAEKLKLQHSECAQDISVTQPIYVE